MDRKRTSGNYSVGYMRRMVEKRPYYPPPCPVTGKVSYATQSKADYVLWCILYSGRDNLRDGHLLHSYQCEYCGWYHIGHHSNRPAPINPATFQLSPEIAAMGAALELLDDYLRD